MALGLFHIRCQIQIGKSLLNPPPFIHGLLHPQTMKPSVLPPELSKTVYFTPWAVFSGGFATVTAGLLTWSPTKLDFLFYDFSMIYYNFSKI